MWSCDVMWPQHAMSPPAQGDNMPALSQATHTYLHISTSSLGKHIHRFHVLPPCLFGISWVFWTLLKYITYTKGDNKYLFKIWMFYPRGKSRRRGKREDKMKRLHNNHQKIIAQDLPQTWKWDSVLHLTPGITDGDHPIKIRSNLLNEGGWRTAACLHSISCNNYTPSGDWMSLVTFV